MYGKIRSSSGEGMICISRVCGSCMKQSRGCRSQVLIWTVSMPSRRIQRSLFGHDWSFWALKFVSSRATPSTQTCGTPDPQRSGPHCLILLGAQPCWGDPSLQFSGDERRRRNKEQPQTSRLLYSQLQSQLPAPTHNQEDLPEVEPADASPQQMSQYSHPPSPESSSPQ